MGDRDDAAIGGEKASEFFSPFDEHESVGVEDILEAKGIKLPGFVEAIEIYVIDPDGFAVFVDQGERGAGDFGRRGNAQGFDEGGDERRFAGAEVARQLHDAAGRE